MDIIARAHDARRPDCPDVFQHNGEAISDFRKAWKAAAMTAGLAGIPIYDMCRSSIRNMVRAGVPERGAMALSGHKTRSVF